MSYKANVIEKYGLFINMNEDFVATIEFVNVMKNKIENYSGYKKCIFTLKNN